MVMIMLFSLTNCTNALVESNQVYAPQGSVAFFRQNGKIGLQTINGEVLHTAEFDGAAYFDVTEQANVYIGDCIGRIDRKGMVIVEPFLCDSIEAISTNCFSKDAPQYVLLVTWHDTDGKKTMRLMNTNGIWLSDVCFDLMIREFKNGKLFIRAGNKYNQIDINGQLTSEEWWEDIFVPDWNENKAETINGDYLYFSNDGELWGKNTVDQSDETHERALIRGGKEVPIPETWEKTEWINRDYVAYCENNLWGVADWECNIIMLPLSTASPDLVNDEQDIWRVFEGEERKEKWIHSDGEIVLSLGEDENIDLFGEDLYQIFSDELTKVIDNNLTIVAKFDGKYNVWRDEKSNVIRYTNWDDDVWGFMDAEGKVLCEYPYTLFFDEYNAELHNGWLRVVDEKRTYNDNEGSCGYVNAYGDMLLSEEWTNIKDFAANQLACVEVNGHYGYINNKGEYVITPQWEYADDFFAADSQWIAPVYKASDYQFIWKGYINENNELVGEYTIPRGEAIMQTSRDESI